MCVNKYKRATRAVMKLMSSDDYLKAHHLDTSPKRQQVRICFLDDEGYHYLDKLKSLGYSNVEVKY